MSAGVPERLRLSAQCMRTDLIFCKSRHATGIKMAQMHETHTGRCNILILRPYLGSIFEKREKRNFQVKEMLRRIPERTMLVQKEDLVKVMRGIWNRKNICQKE